MNPGEMLDKSGWRQGSIVKVKDHVRFGDVVLNDPECRMIVISQSCDIINQSNDEPEIEIIVAQKINALDGNFTYNKNPRKLDLEIVCSYLQEKPAFRLKQTEKYAIEKTLFNQLTPDQDCFIEESQIHSMARWLASRYQRPAFPSVFNERLVEATKRADRKLDKAAKKISPFISGIFVNILPFSEISDDDIYSVNVLALIPEGKGIKVDEDAIKDPVEAIINIMKAAGYEVIYKICFENEVPYSIMRDYKPWSFDHISLCNPNPHECPV